MPESQKENPLRAKLDDIRDRLLADPSREELEEMQLRLDVMEKYDRQLMAQAPEHHHDHMDDHDHSG